MAALNTIFAIDFRALRAFRIAMALVYLGDWVIRATSITAHYTDDGVLPRSALIELYPFAAKFSLNLMSGSEVWQLGIFSAAFFCGIAVLFNFATRTVTPLCWLLLLSIQNRNPLAFHLGDNLFHQLWFWSMFLPWGETRSKRPLVSAASVGLILQIGLVYFFSVFEKTGTPWRVDKSAVFLALNIDQFATPFAVWMRELPIHYLKWATDWVMWVELLAPLCLLLPWASIRLVVVAHLFALHVGFALTLYLGTFPWVCFAALVVLLPSLFWDWMDSLWMGVNRYLMGFNFEFARFAFAGFPGSRIRLVSGKLSNAVMSQVILLGARLDKEIPVKPRVNRGLIVFRRGVLGFLVGYMLLWNVLNIYQWRGITQPLENLFGPLRTIGEGLALNQKWDMFSPFPLIDDGYFEFQGISADGARHDVWIRPGAEKLWKTRNFSTVFYPDERWRRVIGTLSIDRHAGARPHIARYLCRVWNESHPPKAAVQRVVLYYHLEKTAWPPGDAKLERQTLWEGACV